MSKPFEFREEFRAELRAMCPANWKLMVTYKPDEERWLFIVTNHEWAITNDKPNLGAQGMVVVMTRPLESLEQIEAEGVIREAIRSVCNNARWWADAHMKVDAVEG